ncbi:MAG TPA: VOC family protein [Parvularculaceae bacterium]|nr:VOC family protein [Parvularculaceae bacterium]
MSGITLPLKTVSLIAAGALLGAVAATLLGAAPAGAPLKDQLASDTVSEVSVQSCETGNNCSGALFTGVAEIIMVVPDLDAAVKKQWEEFGIGPWRIWTLDSSTVKDMKQRGEDKDFAIRIAYTQIGDVNWELIQPLDENSTYAELLREHGEGVHNIVFSVRDYEKARDILQSKDFQLYGGGDWQGVKFAIFDTLGALPVRAEIFHEPDGGDFPPPERVYP